MAATRPRHLPGLVVATLAQARRCQRHRQHQRGQGPCVLRDRGQQRRGEDGGQLERAVELEVGDQAVPRGRVVERGDGSVVGRRCGEAGSAQATSADVFVRCRRGFERQGAAPTAPAFRGMAIAAIGAQPATAPAAADRAEAGQAPRQPVARPAQASGRSGHWHRLNILPRHAGGRRLEQRAPPRPHRGWRGLAPLARVAAAAVAARRGGGPPGRASGAAAKARRARARLVGRPR